MHHSPTQDRVQSVQETRKLHKLNKSINFLHMSNSTPFIVHTADLPKPQKQEEFVRSDQGLAPRAWNASAPLGRGARCNRRLRVEEAIEDSSHNIVLDVPGDVPIWW
jgi:hypothetical protein